MTTWHQNYDPLDSWPLSTLVSALPVLTLFFVLLVLQARVWVAAVAGMMVAIVLALGVFGMPARDRRRVRARGSSSASSGSPGSSSRRSSSTTSRSRRGSSR